MCVFIDGCIYEDEPRLCRLRCKGEEDEARRRVRGVIGWLHREDRGPWFDLLAETLQTAIAEPPLQSLTQREIEIDHAVREVWKATGVYGCTCIGCFAAIQVAFHQAAK